MSTLRYLAAQLSVGNVELAEHMAGRQSHQVEVGRVPGGQQDSPILRVAHDGLDTLLELVNALTTVVRMHIFVLRLNVFE